MELFNETDVISSYATDTEPNVNDDMNIEQPIGGFTNDCAATSAISRNASETFMWLSNICTNIRVNIRTDQSEESILEVFRSYIRKIRDDMPNCIQLPNRCYILSRNITKMLMVFKSLSNDFADTHEYLINVCELLSIYTILELRYSTKFKESKIAVANRISTNFDIHLPKMNEKYVLKTLMSIKNIYRQKEIMRKLYEKYLVPRHQNGFQKELNDDEYVMYLVNYKLWKYLEDEFDEKLRIDGIANSFMKPSNTLRKNFAYAPYIPKFKSKIEHATKDILSQNFKGGSLMKAIEDNWRRRHNSSNIVIDISSDSVNDWNIEDVHMTPLSFPKIKLENPEVIATVDLTDDHSPENDKQLDWLDCLVTKVRATTVSGRSEQIVETINLDDSDCADEQFEPLSQRNIENSDDLSRNCNSNEINKFPEADLFSPELNVTKTRDNIIGGYFNGPSDSNISKVDVPSKSLPCPPKENRIVQEQNLEENPKVHLEDRTNVSQVCRAMKLLDTASSEVVDSNYNISASKSEKTSDDVQSRNHIKGQLKGLQQSHERNSNSITDTLDKVNYLEAATEPCLSNSGDENQDIQKQVSIHEDYVCSDPPRFNSNQVEHREPNENLFTPTTNSCRNTDSKTKTNAEEHMKNEDNSANFKRRHQSPVNIKTYSNKHKKSSDKVCVSQNDSTFENNQPDLNSLQCDETVETPDKNTESEVLIVNKASNSIEKPDDLNKINDLLIEKLSDSKSSIENTDDVIGVNRSSNINYPAKYSEDYRFEDEDEDSLIKNIAKKLTVHSKKYQAKKRNDVSDSRDMHNTSENTLLDIPVFTSSSDENDDSGESNILSILDESDNSKEDSINFRISGEADSDTHVRKISPKTDICDIKRTNVDNIIFRVSSDNRLSSLVPKNVDVKSFASNVVFSTNKSKHIDQNRSDSNVDMGDISGSLSHPEITSPPMEEFTKSDKTLFKTFLKKTNDSTKFAPMESELDKLLGTDLIPLENNNKKYESQVVNEQVPTTRKNVENLVFSSACNRRKTVSFFGVGDEDKTKDNSYNKVPHIGSQNASKKAVLSGKECWTATINTYRSKNQQLATPSSSTHASIVRPINNSTINTKGNGGSSSPIESGKTSNLLLAIKENLHDEKLFNARVYVRRVDKTVYNRLLLYNGTKIKQQLVPKKTDRGLQRKSYSTLPFNSNKKQTKPPIRRSTLHGGSILTNYRESNNVSDTSDIKLRKKIVVNLLDIAQNPEYKKYFGNAVNVKVGVHNDTLEKSKEKEDKTLLSHRQKKGGYNKWQPDTNVMVNVFQKSKDGELFKRTVGTNNKISAKHKLQQEEVVSKIRKSNSNIVDLNKAELDQHIVTSSINPPVELRMSSSSIHGVEKTRNFNDRVNLEHILNNLQTPTSARVKAKKHYNAPKKLLNKFKISATDGESRINPKHRVWKCQREMDENQVTSTQDNIPIDTNNAFQSKFHSEVDVQHDFVDTTQNYSQFSPLSVIKDSRNRYDSHDYPTTTTNFENVNPSEDMASRNNRITDDKRRNTTVNTNSLISIASTCNKAHDANSAMQAPNPLSSLSPANSDLIYKNGILDMSKTYSNANSIKTVFVPPEIEKIIEGDGN